jgi:hypothetical protein
MYNRKKKIVLELMPVEEIVEFYMQDFIIRLIH